MIRKVVNKVRYYFFLLISRTVNAAEQHIKIVHASKSATFNSSVTLSPSSSILNTQNDKTKIVIGENTVIHGSLMIFGFGGEIHIGDNTFVGAGSNIWSAKKITIGSYVLISHNVNILDSISHPKNHIERMADWDHIRTKGLRTKNEFDIKEKAIIIEDHVWLGYNVSVHRGVTIGKGAIVGSNTIVTKDIPPFAILVGQPGRIIGYAN